MARPLRIEFPGAIYHVMSRGNERGVMVRDDADRQRRVEWLQRTEETYGWRLHSFARVLGEFGQDAARARRAYGRFVRAGVEESPKSPFAAAVGGLVLGSQRFVERVKAILRQRPADAALPQLAPLRCRPSLEQIAAVTAAHYGQDHAAWTPGTRSDDASRAVAAYLARRWFGYPAKRVADALGYRSHGGVRGALARVEAGGDALQQTVSQLAARLR